MIGRVMRFICLPMALLFVYTAGRFTLGAAGVPYAPRGNAIFSVLGLAIISGFYFGALSKKIGGFAWRGTLLVGYSIGLTAQVYIFLATLLSFLLGIETSYFRHWDALNVPEGTVVPMAQAMTSRTIGLVVGPLLPTIASVIGRLAASWAPDKAA
jgi:hypothetical protein